MVAGVFKTDFFKRGYDFSIFNNFYTWSTINTTSKSHIREENEGLNSYQ